MHKSFKNSLPKSIITYKVINKNQETYVSEKIFLREINNNNKMQLKLQQNIKILFFKTLSLCEGLIKFRPRL